MNLVKFQDTKLIHRNSLAFLYISNEQSRREVTETIFFATASKTEKYLGINLAKRFVLRKL